MIDVIGCIVNRVYGGGGGRFMSPTLFIKSFISCRLLQKVFNFLFKRQQPHDPSY